MTDSRDPEDGRSEPEAPVASPKAEPAAPDRPADAGRRRLLLGLAAAPLAGLGLGGGLPGELLRAISTTDTGLRKRRRRRGDPRVVVVGAGAFGGWTALHLRRRGAEVTLLDAWGPGNSRSSSGGETRVIRGVYGGDRIYVEMVADSFRQWREAERRCGRQLLVPTGSLWMVTGDDDAYVRDSLPLLEEHGLPYEELTPGQAGARWPQIDTTGIRWCLHESEAGYLTARRACRLVFERFLEEGGEYRQAAVEPGTPTGGELREVRLSDGGALTADVWVFACGPWLGSLFPDLVGERIRPTRQEVFYFGPPAGDARFADSGLPVWVEWGPTLWYGVPGNRGRGFKVADDTRGPEVDPTSMSRVASRAGREAARSYMERRFPGMAGAPLLESRVCQYENSPDHDLIVDRHPEAGNLWIVGGGSGHGFKMSPAVGRLAADLVLGEGEPPPDFSLQRFADLRDDSPSRFVQSATG